MSIEAIFGSSSVDLGAMQLAARAAVVFLFAVALFRLLPRKSLGDTSVVDFVLTILIGSSLSRALTGNAPLGPVLLGCLVLGALWVGMSWLAIHSDGFSHLVKGRPIVLVRDGVIDGKALRRAQMGECDLLQNLRLQGYAGPEEIGLAYLERNGAISVVREAGEAKPSA